MANALLFLVFLATALVAMSWDRLESLPYHLVWCCRLTLRRHLLRGLRLRTPQASRRTQNLVRGMKNAPLLTEQIDQLGQAIPARNAVQRTDRLLRRHRFAISLDGTLRTVNRRATEFLGVSYGDRRPRIFEFLDEPARADLEHGLPPFSGRAPLVGILKVRKKNSDRVVYFDCVVNAIVKDDEVVGISALARDVTDAREKEQRFTELFETLQEGVYFSTPEGKLLEANAALVRMLGYSQQR